MQLDLRTFAVIIGIIYCFQTAVFAYQQFTCRNYPGVRWWLFWSIAELTGFAFLLLRDKLQLLQLAIAGQNIFIILGVICLYLGIRRFFGVTTGLRQMVSLFLIFLMPFCYFLFVQDNIIIRGVIICCTLALISLLTAQTLLIHRTAALTLTANIAATVFAAHGLFFFFRAAVLLVNGNANADPLATTPLNIATYIDALLCSLMWTFTLIIMINQRLNTELLEAKEEMELVFNTSPDAAIISRLDDGTIIHVNEGFCSLTGFARNEVIGRSSYELGIWNDPADRLRISGALEKSGSIYNLEALFRKRDGSCLSGLVSARTISMQGRLHIISVTKDITERKRMEEQIRHLAYHDVQTGLPTRRLANDRLSMALKEAARDNSSVAVMFLDLDEFKHINDSWGHEAGDAVLSQVAQRLQECVRQTDTVARIGGDEFLIVATGSNARKSAARIAQKVLASLARPLFYGDRQARIGTSIGISLYPEDADTPQMLIRKADQAMYRSKHEGKHRYTFCSEESCQLQQQLPLMQPPRGSSGSVF